ncbi:AP2 domain protein [Theileria parva strain Muguga]|nr:AP2 domain protein [Theileria parva strain Muguga]EAN31527.2 AP2 domain protein [Theileria parva strain Muguga]
MELKRGLMNVYEILNNNKKNASLYYNRLTVVNNLRRYQNSHCWIHETTHPIQPFPNTLKCHCYQHNNTVGGAGDENNGLGNPNTGYLVSGNTFGVNGAGHGTLPEECDEVQYVKKILSEILYNNMIIDFTSSQCISIIYNNHLYLYSNLSTCKYANVVNGGNVTNCNECKVVENVQFTREQVQKALYEIVERGEDNKYGLTLLEHSSVPNLLEGIDKVQSSVKSIGILEGLIQTNNGKKSDIDNINVIHCDILLDDVNSVGNISNSASGSSTVRSIDENMENPLTFNFTGNSGNVGNSGNAGNIGGNFSAGVVDPTISPRFGPDTVAECVKYAKSLIEKACDELNSICSSLVNQLNSYCQPPLNISIRFLEHFMCFEYLIEYSCDLNSLQNTIYGMSYINKENVILHELIQPNLLSKNTILHTFNLLLNRIKLYITSKTTNAMDTTTIDDPVENTNILDARNAMDTDNAVDVDGVLEGEIGTPSPNKNNYITSNDIMRSLKMCETKIVDSSDPNSVSNSNTNTFNTNSENVSPTTHSYTTNSGVVVSDDFKTHDDSVITSKHIPDTANGDTTENNTNIISDSTDPLLTADANDVVNDVVNDVAPEPVMEERVMDIMPYWWRFYVDDNTLGEGEINGRYESMGIRRFTRSYLKEESSTPKNKKHTNGANYLLTRSASSDFSTKSNINLNSSRETLTPTDLSTNTQANEVLPCFCTNCINYISNITRILHDGDSCGDTEDKIDTTDVGLGRSLTGRLSGECNVSGVGSFETMNSDLESDDRIVNGLRRSIRTALEVGSAIKKKISSDYKPLIDTLNVALLSTFRLGEYLFTQSPNNQLSSQGVGNGSSHQLSSHGVGQGPGLGYQGSNGLGYQRSVSQGLEYINPPFGTCRSINSFTPSHQSHTNRSHESHLDSMEIIEELEDTVGELIYLDIGVDSVRSTFENDQYLNYDIMSEDDGSSFTSVSSASPKMFNKRKSPSRSRRAYRSLSSLENLPSSRRSTRDLSQTDDMYIYDMNNLSDKGEFEDWYNEDSDSSKKSVKYVQKRMPPSRPSVSNLTEIYGSQDMLIPMGPLPIGVYFDASRKLWRCQWRENGKFRTKGFSLGHYNTLADARHACIVFRCQVGNMNIQPEWLTPNYIKVSELLNRRSSQPSNNTPKKSNRKKKRQEDLYEPFS